MKWYYYIIIVSVAIAGMSALFSLDVEEPTLGVTKTAEEIKKDKFDSILLTSKIDTENKNGNLTKEELVELKSYAIKKTTSLGTYTYTKQNDEVLLGAVDDVYDIEIVELNEIEGGVEVFARAWKNGVQVGFGSDGTVDIERFRIFNPPVLIDDARGNIFRIIENTVTGEMTMRTLSESPASALRQSLAGIIASIPINDSEHIVSNKRGNTTSTFYSDPHPETTTVDGVARFDGSTSSWATIVSASVADGGFDDWTTFVVYVGHNVSPNQYWLFRQFNLFDTSAIADTDTINSATFSVYWTTKLTSTLSLEAGNQHLRLIQTTPASNTSIVAGDYDQVGTTGGAPDFAVASLTTSAYNDWVLNATGLTWINKTGITKLGMRHTADINAEQPISSSVDQYNGGYGYSADQTGTANDPKLVVVHSAGATPTANPQNIILFEE